MICPKCGVAGIISKAHYSVTGDTSPENATKLYRVMTIACRNKQCENFGKEIGQQTLELPVNEA